MYLGPLLDGKCLRDYPPSVSHKPKQLIIKHETPLGNKMFHEIGYHYEFTLTWDYSVITEAMYEILRVISNKTSSLSFVPYPDKHPSNSFTVKLTNGLYGLAPYKSLLIGYKGTINLETITPVTSQVQWV